MTIGWMAAEWPGPAGVCAGTTLRHGGVSRGAYASLNLGTHVGDDFAAVAENRRRVAAELALPDEPHWLNQVHGTTVLDLCGVAESPCADAAVADAPGRVCTVLTADCLPVLFCDTAGTRIAAAHAGWRGLANGVLEATVERLRVPPDQLLAWLGPAIGPAHFEVGEEVRAAFLTHHAESATAFCASRPGHWFADLYALARIRLNARGVTRIFGGQCCTFEEQARFYSYRRDGGVTGRMASLIWWVE